MLSKILSNRGLLCLAFLFAVIILFARLGAGGIPAAQEGRTAIIVRNMLLTGNWMDMQVAHGIPYEKPIGHYWMCLPFAWAAGVHHEEPAEALSEWAFRLPSALSALAALIAVAILAYRIYGPKTSALSVFILSTMPAFVHLGRLAHIDMPLASAFAWTMLFLYLGYFEKMKCNGWIYGFYAMLGWGVVLKGPLVVILAGIVILIMMLVTKRWKMIWELRPLTGAVVFLLIALPWYIAETIRTDGAFFEEFIINQNLRRFTGIGSTYRNGRRMPFYYYVPKMMAEALPWTVFALIAAVCSWKKLIRLKLTIPSLFLFVWFASGFLFFSGSALKRGDYLLPLYAPLAIMTAAAIIGSLNKLPNLTKKWLWGWGAAVILLGGALYLSWSGFLIRFAQMCMNGQGIHMSKTDARNLIMISEYFNQHICLVIPAVIIMLVILALFGLLLEKGKWKPALLAFCFLTFLGFTAFYTVADPATAVLRTVKPFTEEARKVIPPGTMFTHCNVFNTELLYFMNRPYDVKITEETRYVITDFENAEQLEKHGWVTLLQTDKRHQYPAVLLERRKK